MVVKQHCPEESVLAQLSIGLMSPEEVEQLAEHCEHCNRCLRALQELHAEDTVTEALRSQTTVADDDLPERVRELMRCFKGQRVASGERANSDATTLPPSELNNGGSVPSELPSLDQAALPQASPLSLEYFQIEKVLGEGGMGTVYLANDTRLGRQVALKTLKRSFAANPAAKDRFLREARSAARLEHDNITPHLLPSARRITHFWRCSFFKGSPWMLASGERKPTEKRCRFLTRFGSYVKSPRVSRRA